MVISCPCIGDIKVLQTLFALSFASEVLAGLRAALYSFHGRHEKAVPCLLAPRLYHASVYWFLSLVLSLSIA